jgi:hypothetical protein
MRRRHERHPGQRVRHHRISEEGRCGTDLRWCVGLPSYARSGPAIAGATPTPHIGG